MTRARAGACWCWRGEEAGAENQTTSPDEATCVACLGEFRKQVAEYARFDALNGMQRYHTEGYKLEVRRDSYAVLVKNGIRERWELIPRQIFLNPNKPDPPTRCLKVMSGIYYFAGKLPSSYSEPQMENEKIAL